MIVTQADAQGINRFKTLYAEHDGYAATNRRRPSFLGQCIGLGYVRSCCNLV